MGRFDTKMKEFWRDNGHFADLFNAVVFGGKEILHPEMLLERDTDENAEIRSKKKYLDTVVKARDVVKKAAFDTEFVLLGIENQLKTDYSMPVRTMMYDSLGYWKECKLLTDQNMQDSKNISAEELFSIKREDRLHPIVTLILYYGEDTWDGPRSLLDMLKPVGKEILRLIPDYPLNLVEIRESDHLNFHNQDVNQVFSLVRKIYRKVIDETFEHVRKDLVAAIAVIVGSEKIAKIAERSKKEEVNMCRALEEMMQEREEKGLSLGKIEGLREGRCEGLREGELRGKIYVYREFGLSPERIAEKLDLSIAEVNAVSRGDV